MRGSAAAVGQFFHDIREHGLRDALAQAGYHDIDNLSPTDLVLLLAELLGGADSTIDGVDLQNALCNLLQDLTDGATSLEAIESSLLSAGNRLEQVICDLIGNYIFERYNTTFAASLDDRLSMRQSDLSLDEVRRYIDTQVQLESITRDLSKVNWRGGEGAQIVEEILEHTIHIFTGAE